MWFNTPRTVKRLWGSLSAPREPRWRDTALTLLYCWLLWILADEVQQRFYGHHFSGTPYRILEAGLAVVVSLVDPRSGWRHRFDGTTIRKIPFFTPPALSQFFRLPRFDFLAKRIYIRLSG